MFECCWEKYERHKMPDGARNLEDSFKTEVME